MNIYIYCVPTNEHNYVKYAEIGLRRLGHTVYNKMDLSFRKDEKGFKILQDFDEIAFIKENKIDLILFYGFSFMNHFVHQTKQFLPQETGLPYIVIWHDNPFRYLYHLNFLKNTNYHFFCCDSDLSIRMGKAGFKCDWLPTFFCSDYQKPGDVNPKLFCDISFPGSMFTVESLIKGRIGKNCAENRVLDNLIQERIRGKYLDYTTNLIIEGLCPEDGRFGDLAICNILEQKYLLRTEVFDILRPLQIHLYGQGYMDEKRHPNVKKMFNLNQQEELPHLYRSSKISLSIELLPSSVHQRIMECIGCGGFIMMENKMDNEKCFGGLHKEATWDTLGELKEKVEFFLKNDTERRRISTDLYEYSIKAHDCHHRMKEMLNLWTGEQ